jgi:pyruvate ferredoxin oxidoreductase alpha subunit
MQENKKKRGERRIIECSEAIAHAVKQCKPGVIATYPITPQTHIVEHLASMVANGKLNSEIIDVESEHSAMSACIGAQACGVRTFTASSSQGIALMSEMLFIASGMRLPIIMAVANRALSAPINIWNDHSDTMAQRDTGWIQFYCENTQEAYDTIIQAYKISENANVMLPSMVCVDGFTLSHLWEPITTIEQKNTDLFLQEYKPLYKLYPEHPMTFGPISYPNTYMHFKRQQQDAMINSIGIIKKVNNEFKGKFGRGYGDGLVETYCIDDAETALLCMGSVCGTARDVIDMLRKKGKKVGLIKLKTFRPFPHRELEKFSKLKSISVIDRAISLGNAGPIYTEVKSSLSDAVKIKGFIAGLGGKDITEKDLVKALDKKQRGGWL